MNTTRQIEREERSTQYAIIDIFVAVEKFNKYEDRSNNPKIAQMQAEMKAFIKRFDDGESQQKMIEAEN